MVRSSTRVLSSALVCVAGFGISSVSFAGWHIGDPLPVSISHSSQVQITTFSLPVDELQLRPCGGGNLVHQHIGETMTPTHGLVIPQGCWESVSIVQSGDLTVSGYTPTNHTLTMSISTGPIDLVMDHDLEVVTGGSTEDVWIELLAPEWYTNELQPYVSSSSNVSVDYTHARYPYLQDSLGLDSAMHMD